MKKNKKEKYIDDGHTIYSMDGLRKDKEGKLDVNKKEKRAIIKAAMAVYLPRFLLIILAFVVTILLMYFWLK